MSENGKQAATGNFVLVLVAMVLGVLIGVMTASHKKQEGIANNGVQGKINEVLQLLEDEYVDELDTDTIGERLLQSILRELDPHSTYLPPRDMEQTDELMRGTFEGVGLVLRYSGDTTYVNQVLEDGPSANIGILPGDMIFCVDGDTVSGVGMKTDSVVARLRGPRGSKVLVETRRLVNGKETPFSWTIKRGTVPHHTIACSTMLDDTTGYIVLTSFASTSYSEFRKALADLKQRGMRSLIFDLRGNGGGSLQDAVGIASELLPSGSLIVYTEGAHSRRRNQYARHDGLFTKGGVVVLVDEQSASASEVVCGALQDNDRAVIAGRRTFGKGLVQIEERLSDGSAVLLTTARYYTPSGRCIQRSYDNGTEEYYRDYFDQILNEAYADSMTVAILDSTPYYTVKGRVVYGGGGIAPDVPLTYRKHVSYVYYNALSRKGIIRNVAFEYLRSNVAELMKRYPDEESFNRGFKVDDSLVREVVQRGDAAGIAKDDESLMIHRSLITSMLKAFIGSSLFGDGAFYENYFEHDDDLQRVREMMKVHKI